MSKKILAPVVIVMGLSQFADPVQSGLPREAQSLASAAKTSRSASAMYVKVSNPPITSGPAQIGAEDSKALSTPSRAEMAGWLAAVATMIDITPEQRDAWNDYSGALQALLTPSRHRFRVVNSFQTSNAPDPFSRDQWLVEEFRLRADAADRLSSAIGVLRGVLTPSQKAKLASAYGLN